MTGPPADDAAPQDETPSDGVALVLPAAHSAAERHNFAEEIRTNRHVVLVGGGHAHLQIIRWWGRQPIPHAQLTVVSAFGRMAYSAMLPGVVAGQYSIDEMMVDLPTLCRRCGAQLIVDRAVRLDAVERRIELAHQPSLTFDVASVNIGSAPVAELLCQLHRMLVSLQPLASFSDRFETRLQELLQQHRQARRADLIPLAIVGGGAAGVELALCLEERVHAQRLPVDVMLVEGGGAVLPRYSEGAARHARRLLRKRGIEVYVGRRIAGCDEDGPTALVLDDGERLPCELAIWAAGPAPPAVLKGFELPKSSRGYLSVRPTLQSTADVPVFAVGDVADLFGEFAPKAGVYAVRQAPVLWQNIQRLLAGKPLRRYRPQRAYLSLLNCGDGTAILDYRGWSARSQWAWRLKRWIDRRFVDQFR